MNKLREIIQSINLIEKDLAMNFTDDMVLDCATRILNSSNIQDSKVKKESTEVKNPITEKQKKLLIKAIEQKATDLTLEDLARMSRSEAYLKIKELMGKD